MTGNRLKLNNDKTEDLPYVHSLFVVFSFVSSVPSHIFVFCTVPLSKDCHLSVLCFVSVFSIYLFICLLIVIVMIMITIMMMMVMITIIILILNITIIIIIIGSSSIVYLV